MTSLANNLVSLRGQRQSINLNDIVQHACKYSDDFTEIHPVEACFIRKRTFNETRQVDRSKQTGTVRRQWLLTAGISSPDGFAEPVVV